jgi:hypothetical protein
MGSFTEVSLILIGQPQSLGVQQVIVISTGSQICRLWCDQYAIPLIYRVL